MVKRQALGKGLGALIPKATTTEGDARLLELGIDQIRPNPDQPRKHFDEESLRELAESIKAKGLLQPLVVRRRGPSYQIIVGERRWRAAQLAGISTVPALLNDTDDISILELALIENIHREDLNPLEEAHAYQLMIDRLHITQEEVANRVGKDRSTVANMLRLQKLHDDVKKALVESKINMGHARALLALSDPYAQRDLCQTVIRQGLNVRQTEQKVKQLAAGKPKPAAAGKKPNPFIRDAEERLARSLQARVAIKPARRGGKIEIKYSTEDELQRLFDILSRE